MNSKSGFIESFYSKDYVKRLKDELTTIEDSFDINDINVYEWQIFQNKNNYKYLFGSLIIYMIGPILVSLLVYFLISLLSIMVAYWFAFGSFIWYSFKIIAGVLIKYLLPVIKKDFKTNIFKAGKLDKNLSFVIAALAFLMYTNYSYFSGLFSSYESITEWLLFYLDNLLKIVLLDTIEILGLKFSSIEPAHWKGRAMVYLLNLLLTIGLVDAIIAIIKQARLNLSFHGTTKDFVTKAYDIGLSGSYNIKFKRIGIIEELKEEPEFLLESFMFKFDDFIRMAFNQKESNKKSESSS